MRLQYEIVSGPEIEPISLADMKTHLRAYASTERDDEITELIKAAREWVEEYTGQVLVDQTLRLSIDRNDTWLDANESVSEITDSSVPAVYLRRAPILEIVSVKTVDADGAETTIATSEYELRAGTSKWPYLVPTSTGTWQESNLRITFRAGFADQTGSPQDDVSVIPARFMQAMKLWASGIYDRDEHSTEAAMKLAKTLKAQVGFA